jgi:hypothetical protein
MGKHVPQRIRAPVAVALRIRRRADTQRIENNEDGSHRFESPAKKPALLYGRKFEIRSSKFELIGALRAMFFF